MALEIRVASVCSPARDNARTLIGDSSSFNKSEAVRPSSGPSGNVLGKSGLDSIIMLSPSPISTNIFASSEADSPRSSSVDK